MKTTMNNINRAVGVQTGKEGYSAWVTKNSEVYTLVSLGSFKNRSIRDCARMSAVAPIVIIETSGARTDKTPQDTWAQGHWVGGFSTALESYEVVEVWVPPTQWQDWVRADAEARQITLPYRSGPRAAALVYLQRLIAMKTLLVSADIPINELTAGAICIALWALNNVKDKRYE